ncbi:hypothetical protein TCSYLVIO_006832 [Trypanosoma cruzi]|uniref:Thioesterase domain-containing protein n=1 Tax=Trypanosoma cruzi TaxID=5693 RepID=A0A2V2UZ38_TRYCR|nr:hypothetical protein TCSYLVIO_006832 [Trypanosoma cruzi]KAF8304515.1 hypothetical protein TcBrA4_0047220 [Trypanosoma cruzi]PBJ69100.1 hypothetical protein BCY84_20427 [Trypanosoma cruzi cruzi]PWU89627.1 hypothetical protein C4B63_58g137 [Trypanosoma cruzi]RNF21824.1 thioesterase superfamily protein [Trypanosoma cruzi]
MATSLENVVWAPVMQVFPNYLDIHAQLRGLDNFGFRLLEEQLQMVLQDVFVAVERPPTNSAQGQKPKFPYAMAWPIRITPAVTEGDGTLSQGAVLAITDMFTSFHAMLALLPSHPGHVSVSMQCNRMQTIREKDAIIVVTRIDKIGNRLIFTTAEFLRSMSPAVAVLEFAEKGIDAAIRCHSLCSNVKHVKAVLTPIIEAPT